MFVGLLFIGDRLGAWGLQKLVATSQDRYVAMYEGRAKADILVLGNSRADNHFPPQMMHRTLDVATVNLGLGGVSATLAEALMKDFIERNGAPRLIVLEATVLEVDPVTIGDMMIFVGYSPRIAALVKGNLPRLYYTRMLFNLFQYNNEMFWRILYHVWNAPFDRVHHGSMTPALLEQIRKRSAHMRTYVDNEAALRRMLDYAQQRGVPVRIVITPYLKDQFAKFTNFESWKARVEQLARGQKIWDYSRSFDDPALFRDSVHMNTAGTAKLLQVMVNDGFYDELRSTKENAGDPTRQAVRAGWGSSQRQGASPVASPRSSRRRAASSFKCAPGTPSCAQPDHELIRSDYVPLRSGSMTVNNRPYSLSWSSLPRAIGTGFHATRPSRALGMSGDRTPARAQRALRS